MAEKETWSSRIRLARSAAGVSLDRVAAACGTTRQTVIAWERGQGPGPRMPQIGPLCEVLGIVSDAKRQRFVFGVERAT